MTIIFNVFVYYTPFNQINCRVLDDSFNILIRITRSILFIIICIFETGLQAVLITWGNTVFHCIESGLAGNNGEFVLDSVLLLLVLVLFVN